MARRSEWRPTRSPRNPFLGFADQPDERWNPAAPYSVDAIGGVRVARYESGREVLPKLDVVSEATGDKF